MRPLTQRDARRESRRADLARIQTARRKALLQKKRQEQTRRAMIIGIALVIVLLLGFVIYRFASQPSSSSVPTTGPGAGITCDQLEHSVTHYHTAVHIAINGVVTPLPANIGINQSGGCLYWIHTHDTSGVVHIEAPANARAYTLNDFMYIWKVNPGDPFKVGTTPQTISSSQFLGLPVDKDHPLRAYVDGKLYTGDIGSIQLKSLQNIWLVYGKIDVPLTNYNFAANGLSQ